jgi:catechol 2,3-dioxygenase-like lactoylglutathione lyase family enzyme
MPQGKRLVGLLTIAAMALPWHGAAAQSSATPQSQTEPRIAFVKIDVNDLDAAVSSYCKALQMQDIGRIHNKAPLLDEATLKFGETPDSARAGNTAGIVLVFVPGRKMLRGTPDKTPSAVLTVPDVAATVERGKAAGFTVVGPPKTVGGFTVGSIQDAGGNVIELIHLP